MDAQSLLLGALFFAAAVLYSSVGHGGASGYLAAMGLVGMPAPLLRPTALLMNVAVATVSMLRFARAGRDTGGTNWRLFWPFALGSVPLAYVGGRLALPTHIHATLIGAVLLYSAVRMLLETRPGAPAPARSGRTPPPLVACICIGAAIGLLAGLTGVGGGIFLSPLIVLMGWATVREAAAPTAAFVLINSISGLIGLYARRPDLPDALPLWLAAVVAGAVLGSWLGARKWNSLALRRALAVVLAIAGLKMIF